MVLSLERYARQWAGLLDSTPPAVREAVRAVAQQHAPALAQRFYADMLKEEGTLTFLAHSALRQRLEQSLQRWVHCVFDGSDAQISQKVAQQVHVGEVHARIDVPVHLVLHGARALKAYLRTLLPQPEAAAHHASALVDLCMEIMSQAYARSVERTERTKDAYRLHAITHNIGTERERQRAALLDWENQLLCELAMERSSSQLPRMAASDFGLWFHHKGEFLFRGAQEVVHIQTAMQHMDHVLLPSLEGRYRTAQRQQQLRGLREAVRGINYQLAALFEQHQELDAGRDALTRLLNRKFLPVVMGKEMAHAQSQGETFAVLVVDVDHFKAINDRYGHESGDRVLQQMAEVLQSACRGGDYVFRLGGEEFLLLLVDVGEAQSVALAERLRQRVQREPMRLPQERSTEVTVSIGVALYDGYPDYQRMLQRADAALYQAKELGRNQVKLG